MPIFINWFEVELSSTEQHLPVRTFGTWEESRDFHQAAHLSEHKCARTTTKSEMGDHIQTVLLEELEAMPEGFQMQAIDLRQQWEVCSKAIEFNLAKNLEEKSITTHRDKFGITATSPQFVVEKIGLHVEAGISFKAHYLRTERKHGIILDWRVRQTFLSSYAEFTSEFDASLMGSPVTLTPDLTKVDEALHPYCARYLGVAIELNSTHVVIACRDGEKRSLPREVVFPEARGDVIAKLYAQAGPRSHAESLARRVQTLAYSLTTTGRRNLRIQQDKLKAAINFLNPDNRPFLNVTLRPPCSGTMRISSAPAIARNEQSQYV